MNILLYPMLALLLMAALFVARTENILAGIIALSIFSSLLVVIFVLFNAPDVALAQAVVSAGLSTVFFIFSLNKVERILDESRENDGAAEKEIQKSGLEER